ncbi:MAG: ribonuclease HI [Pontiellaceae bacterium]|nr:ribonuclease HI [Pontiellaceae bacterium]MBN2783848.1 ribonuclease HI [Pontiellaceae bacterium]
MQNEIQIYTDGACKGNPGPGGYGVVLLTDRHRKELSGGFRKTTNNRMELLACIEGLSALKRPSVVVLTSDSKYVVDAMAKGWSRKWCAKGWKLSPSKPAKNPDLWSRLLALCDEHDVRFEWVKGHSAHPENERCDILAVEASTGKELPPDAGFEDPAQSVAGDDLFSL